jgi:hypothetical protein
VIVIAFVGASATKGDAVKLSIGTFLPSLKPPAPPPPPRALPPPAPPAITRYPTVFSAGVDEISQTVKVPGPVKV